MSFLNKIYKKSLIENENNIKLCADHLQKLEVLDFSVYAEKLKLPTLVPIGNRIFFRGELKHTNEVTVALGADYFVKCSHKQAEEIRQHRIRGIKSKLETYLKEKEYLENQLSITAGNVCEGHQGQDIVEVYSEEEDLEWRKKHREKLRNYKQKNKNVAEEEVTDEEIWNRLEELELKEELDNELQNLNDYNDTTSNENIIVKDKFSQEITVDKTHDVENNEKVVKKVTFMETDKTMTHTPKLDLLQQVIDKQNELEQKLFEIKNKEKVKSVTEEDLISKLDEMEMLDELEDEMERLEDVLESKDLIEEKSDTFIQKTNRRVSFADEDDSETLEITFKHSDVIPSDKPYSSDQVISKPSDIYTAYSNLFDKATTSVLKKNTKYIHWKTCSPEPVVSDDLELKSDDTLSKANHNEIIVVNDIVEKGSEGAKKFDTDVRPTSLFKMRRQQKKLK